MPPIRSDSVLPSLFDRLTESKLSFQGDDLYMSHSRYLDTVRRDLLWLLKTDVSRAVDVLLTDSEDTPHDAPPASLADFPEASRSVLAFGVPFSRGEIATGSPAFKLGAALKEIITTFEPRLGSCNVIVSVKSPEDRKEDDPISSVISIKIQGQVRMKPVSQDLVVQAYYTPAFAQWRIEGTGNGP